MFTPRKFEVYEFWPGDFLALFEQAGIPRRVPLPLCRRLAAGWPVGPDKNQSLSLRTPKRFHSFRQKQFRYPPKSMPMCVKFSGSPASNSLAKLHRIRFSSGPQPPAITKLLRSMTTAARVRTASLCDEMPETERVFQAKRL